LRSAVLVDRWPGLARSVGTAASHVGNNVAVSSIDSVRGCSATTTGDEVASAEYEASVWERYATEFALALADTPTRIRAVRDAYFRHGFDVDVISHLSGFPVWRIRQALSAGSGGPMS
jgi:hypothetical protein